MNEHELETVEETVETLEELVETVEETAEEAVEETEAPAEEQTYEYVPLGKVDSEPKEEKEPRTRKQKITGTVIIAVVAALAVAVAIAVGIVYFMPKNQSHHINAHGYDSWSIHYHTHEGDSSIHFHYLDEDGQDITVTPEEVNDLIDNTVASCGDMTLDNRSLQYFYDEEHIRIVSTYANYISYIMDPYSSMDSQICMMDEGVTQTWQKYLLDKAVYTFLTTSALYQDAQKNGYVMTDDQRSYVDGMIDLETQAMVYGFPDALSLVKVWMGPTATVESVSKYFEETATANFYAGYLAEQEEITEEELSAYYDANANVFQTQNILKSESNNINVRHILIQPEAAEDGTISEEALAAAEAEAQRILDEWKAGEATEASFGELAKTYSADTGSASMGGLYEDVYPGQMVTEFSDWCFDASRQPGDTDIVKTTFGYHIMYFVSQTDSSMWKEMCRQQLISEKISSIYEQALENYSHDVSYKDMILIDSSEATRPETGVTGVTTETTNTTNTTDTTTEVVEPSTEVEVVPAA